MGENEGQLDEKARVSKSHRDVLRLLAERTEIRMPDPGCMTSSATFADSYNVFVHWSTAQALHRAGLVSYPYIGTGLEGDATSVALTQAGWAVVGVEPPCFCKVVGVTRDPYEPHMPAQPEYEQADNCPAHPNLSTGDES